MFSFNPLSDEQITELKNRELLADGVYPFIVKAAELQESKSGNLMMKVKIAVLANRTDERNIIDYITASEQMIFKVKHFCESIGLYDEYKKGNLPVDHCINRSGKVRIGIEKGSAKPDGSGFYADKNCVKDYVLPEVAPKPLIDPNFNDDIKF